VTSSTVGIVSIFGRGHWLANQLAKAGVPVSLIDISSSQGPWAEIDTMGPFGSFKADIQPEQNIQIQKEGFCLWLNDGPLELSSVNCNYRTGKLGLSKWNREYIERNESNSREIQKLPFHENWLAQFSHFWNASISTTAAESLTVGRKINLFDKFSYYRSGQERSLDRSLAVCEKNKVNVFRAKQIKDLAIDKKGVLSGLELQTEKSLILKCERFVWCLSQAETRKLSEKVRGVLFPLGVKYPEWAWVRYRVQIHKSEKLEHWLPGHFVILGDVYLPWSHENVVVLQKTEADSIFDCWIKIPHAQRFQNAYLQNMAKKIEVLLEKKMAGEDAQIIEWPLEMQMDEQKLGPSPFAIYKKSDHAPKNKDWDNVQFDGPEYWKSSCNQGKLETEQAHFITLKIWWDKKLEQLAKKAKEQSR
jgi:hypothetical protein